TGPRGSVSGPSWFRSPSKEQASGCRRQDGSGGRSETERTEDEGQAMTESLLHKLQAGPERLEAQAEVSDRLRHLFVEEVRGLTARRSTLRLRVWSGCASASSSPGRLEKTWRNWLPVISRCRRRGCVTWHDSIRRPSRGSKRRASRSELSFAFAGDLER